MLSLLQASGILAALCCLVALVRADANPADGGAVAWRYSLRSLLIVVTAAAVACGFTSTALRMGIVTVHNVGAFAVLSTAAVSVVIAARWLGREA